MKSFSGMKKSKKEEKAIAVSVGALTILQVLKDRKPSLSLRL